MKPVTEHFCSISPDDGSITLRYSYVKPINRECLEYTFRVEVTTSTPGLSTTNPVPLSQGNTYRTTTGVSLLTLDRDTCSRTLSVNNFYPTVKEGEKERRKDSVTLRTRGNGRRYSLSKDFGSRLCLRTRYEEYTDLVLGLSGEKKHLTGRSSQGNIVVFLLDCVHLNEQKTKYPDPSLLKGVSLCHR